MSRLPLTARVVEVIADLGEKAHPRNRYGSGCIVAGRTVLTAAHVVDGAVTVWIRGTDKVRREATLDPRFIGDVNGPGPDLALVEIKEPAINMPPVGLGAVDRDSPTGDLVGRCHAIGYPAFMQRSTPDGGEVRDTVDAYGHVPVLSGLARGLLSVQVSSTPRLLPSAQVALGDSEWSGMSGGPLVADGYLLGAVTEHATRQGPSAITVTPLTALEIDPAHPGWGAGVADPGAWWARLGASGVGGLHWLPARRGRVEPAYWATVREIHRRTELLIGRQRELAEVASFAVGSEGYRWMVGGPWAGKTTLLAEAVEVWLPEDVDVVCYFLSRREGEADSARFLASVVPQLAYICDVEAPDADLHQFRALWHRAVERTAVEGRHLLLVVDGLDEDVRPAGLPSIAAQLPFVAGGRVHVLVTSRPDWDRPDDLPAGHPLGPGTARVRVKPFVPDYGGALAAFGNERWGEAAELLATVLARYPGHPRVTQLLDHARREQQLAEWDVEARNAADQNRWTAAVRALEQIVAVQGGYQDATHRLIQASRHRDVARLQASLRRLHKARQWAAVESVGEQLAKLDPAAADPDGLVTAAKGELAKDAATPREVAVGSRIASLAVSHDGRRLATGSRGAHVWNLRNGELIWQQTATRNKFSSVTGVAFSPDGRRLTVGTEEGMVQLWDLRSGDLIWQQAVKSRWTTVTGVAFSPDGRLVATGSSDGRGRIWDADSGSRRLEVRHEVGAVQAVAFSPDSLRLGTGGHDGTARIWHASGGGQLQKFSHDRAVWAVAFNPDGQRLATGSDDGKARIWAIGAGRLEFEVGSDDWPVRAVAFSPDGQLLATGSDDGAGRIWWGAGFGSSRLRDSTRQPELEARHGRRMRAVAFSANGLRLLTGSDDGTVRLWDVPDWRED